MSREPIRADELAEAIAPWRLDLRQETGSTNADATAAAREGAPEGLVVMAESQSAGRGRLGRSWVTLPRAGLAMSVLLRPTVEMAQWGWLPLLTGIALADTIPGSGLKWPNDLLVGGRKCGGILVEAVSPGVAVVGIGLNVSLTEAQLPQGVLATSLALAGIDMDRTKLAIDLITRLRQRYEEWPNPNLRDEYLERCLTVGQDVRAILPSDSEITGKATTVDDAGRLIIRTETGQLCPIAAADVTHVR